MPALRLIATRLPTSMMLASSEPPPSHILPFAGLAVEDYLDDDEALGRRLPMPVTTLLDDVRAATTDNDVTTRATGSLQCEVEALPLGYPELITL